MRNQGLPFSTIVLAILSLLILVLIVFFVTGGLGRLFPAMGRQGVSELQEARTVCMQRLSEIQSYLQMSNLPTSSAINSTFRGSSYCSSSLLVEGQTRRCFESPINVTADFVVYTSGGTPVRCRASATGGGCQCSQI